MSASTQTPRKEPARYGPAIQPPNGAKLRDRAAAGFIFSLDVLRKWAHKVDETHYKPDEDPNGNEAFGDIMDHLERHSVYLNAVFHLTEIARREFMLVTQIKLIKGVQGWEGMPKEMLPTFEEEREEEDVRARLKEDGLDEADFYFDRRTINNSERWVIGQPFLEIFPELCVY